MKQRTLIIIILSLILLLVVTAVATAADSMPGMDMGDGAKGGQMKGMDHGDYKPPQVPANDNTMAMVVSGIFGLPIAGWFVSRSVRKAKKNNSK